MDKKNDYLVGKGLLPKGLSHRIKAVEKGSATLITVGALFILYAFVTVMIAADRLS